MCHFGISIQTEGGDQNIIRAAVVVHWLFDKYPNQNQGYLSKEKSSLVNNFFLVKASDSLNLINYVKVDDSIDLNNIPTKNKISCDLYEAIVGAIFLDSNFQSAKKFIHNSLLNRTNILNIKEVNNKGNLIEFCHQKGIDIPSYQLIENNGPSHKKKFKIKLLVNGKEFFDTGLRIKEAEEQAALKALTYFKFF